MVSQPSTDSKYDYAIWYAAELGWPVFPCWWIEDGNCACGDHNCDSAGKHPNSLQVRQGVKNASANVDTIAQWWTNAPDSNIAMATDHHPVIDLDTKEAMEFIRQYINGDALCPKARTGRGGLHIHMEPHTELICGNAVGGIKGLDIKADGGYVIVPPSNNASGSYEWSVPPDEPLLPWPPELIQWVLSHQGTKPHTTEPGLKPSDFFGGSPQLADHPGAAEGSRNSELCRLVGAELARGVDREEVFRLALDWGSRCQPPYPPNDVARTVTKLADKHSTNGVATKSSNTGRAFSVIDLASHEPEPIEWLWTNWLPLDALVFVNGDPESGKTWLMCDLTARITAGRFFPDATVCQQGKVLYCSAEDTAEVIKTRIANCGGGLDQVLIPLCGEHGDETGLLLKMYLQELEATLRDNPDIRLVVLDTISALLPDVDFHKLEQVQRGCQVLKVLAKRYNVTVAALHHLPKDAGKRNLIHASSGSVGFTAAPRAAVLVAVEPGTDRRIMFPQKMSWAKKPRPLAYTIEDDKVVWGSEPVEVTWEQLNAPPESVTATNKARKWLERELAGASVSVKHLKEQSKRKSFSWRTVERAANDLRVEKIGEMKDRFWKLPD